MKIHFIGIGGISMSGLALICKKFGYEVTGSDRDNSDMVKKLRASGITVGVGHKIENIQDDTDLVVYTAAIPHDNVELAFARNSGIKTEERAVFLGQLMRKYSNSIAISGTHGKTTTTSMVTQIFVEANEDPTSMIGGEFSLIGGNLLIGKSDLFITEACEYVDSFLNFYPKIAVILDVEADHLDYFKDIDAIIASFRKFASQVSDDGVVVANGDDTNVRKALDGLDRKICYFGLNPDNDYVISDVRFSDRGCPIFKLSYHGDFIGEFALGVVGRHNVYDSTAAIIASLLNGIDVEKIKSALSHFSGVGRRFELKGNIDGVDIYDDYAHHPTEIRATLDAIKFLNENDVYVIFQPHTYTRTKQLFTEFVDCFKDCKNLILADIYSAREPFDPEISSKMIVDEVNKLGNNALYFDSFDKIYDYVRGHMKSGDAVFTVGAGNVNTIGMRLLDNK